MQNPVSDTATSPGTPPDQTGSVKPRVCLLISNFYPVVGGGERHAHLLSKELARMGLTVTVLTRRRKREFPQFEHMDGFTVHRVGPSGFARWGKYLMLVPAIHRLWTLRHEYDIIYVCGLRVLGLAGLIGSHLAKKPCVLRSEARGELSGEFVWQRPGGRRSPLRYFLGHPIITARNQLFLRADHFLCISTPIDEEFRSAGVPPAKLTTIPNGLDLSMFRPLPPGERPGLRRSLGLPVGPIFAYSGKLNRGKGLELLLRVWSRFLQTHPGAHLVLVGSGAGQHLSCEAVLREFVTRHNLKQSVTFTGYVDCVADYLNAADVFIFPSESESMGLVLLEALACETPVIASRIPGIMDVITDGENGRLVDATDEAAWQRAMEETLAEQSETGRLVRAGRQSVLTKFSIHAVATQHVQLFARCLR